MNVQIIPDFLPKPMFDQLTQIIFARQFNWNLLTRISSKYSTQGENTKAIAMGHMVYDQQHYAGANMNAKDLLILQMLVSNNVYYDTFANYYDIIGEPLPEGSFLEMKKLEDLLRIKINFYPTSETLYEHPMHTDHDFPHRGALLSLNTCDGYTKLQETGEKYPSVANTLLLFNSSKHHCSTNTTSAVGRFNININYLQ